MYNSLYTIGYATKPITTFIEQLKHYDIQVVADIRSVPYSNAFYDYHQEAIESHLKQHHIRYVYLGNELGPRSKEDDHYDNTGQVQFDRLMQSTLFLSGIDRLYTGLEKSFSIALMCAEKDPATCHRSLLVGYYLQHLTGKKSITLKHILHDGRIETQPALEERLVDIHLLGNDLFSTPDQQQKLAYKTQLALTSYRKT